jgi:hypothetical protein
MKIEDIKHYFIGHIRNKIYQSKYRNIIRQHIIEQIEYRLKVVDRVCYNSGSCKMCGCAMPALQMANKMCHKPCYPPMMSKSKWIKFTNGEKIKIDYKIYDLGMFK